MLRAVLLAGLVFARPTAAEAWQDLSGLAILGALQQHQVHWDNGSAQVFVSGGVTYFTSGWLNEGRWRIEDDSYCSRWPPNMDWICFGVQADGAGRVRFLAADGQIWEGHIVEAPD